MDRDKVLKQGVDLQAVYRTLQAFMGGAFVNYFNRFGRVWQVYVQAEGEFRTDAKNAGQFFVRNDKGDMVPLSTLVKMETIYGPEFTNRFNGYRSAQINGILAPGYSSGQAMQALEEVFAQTMPREMGYDYSGMSFQEKLAAERISPSMIFGLSLLFVFLILAAQYESWSLPFSVLLSTPVAVFGAFLALWLHGFVNNVYAQIGLVMLIGLSAKNAILIVEFAKLEYERGKSIEDAALAAARLRLRPILMTAFAFILRRAARHRLRRGRGGKANHGHGGSGRNACRFAHRHFSCSGLLLCSRKTRPEKGKAGASGSFRAAEAPPEAKLNAENTDRETRLCCSRRFSGLTNKDTYNTQPVKTKGAL